MGTFCRIQNVDQRGSRTGIVTYTNKSIIFFWSNSHEIYQSYHDSRHFRHVLFLKLVQQRRPTLFCFRRASSWHNISNGKPTNRRDTSRTRKSERDTKQRSSRVSVVSKTGSQSQIRSYMPASPCPPVGRNLLSPVTSCSRRVTVLPVARDVLSVKSASISSSRT